MIKNKIMRIISASIVLLLLCVGTAAAAESYSFVKVWGSEGSGEGQFLGPQAVAVDSAGNIYVLDTGNNRVEKFDAAGTFIIAWGGTGTGQSEFNNPQGIVVDTSDFVYVADTGNHRIQKFNSAGTFLTEWGSQGSGESQFESPIGIATDSADGVYVADSGNCRVQKFDSVGISFGEWAVECNPYGIAVDGSNVYVSDSWGRVRKYNSAGEYLLEWAISSPSHLAVDGSNHIFSVSPDRHIVQKYDSNGVLIVEWGSEGAVDGQLETPRGIAVTDSNHVFVADTGNNRVQEFALVEPPPPTITSITPNYGTQGTTVNLRIDGSGFLAGAVVRLQMDGHTDITATNVAVVSGNWITCTVTLRDTQTLGAWAVRVTNIDGQYAVFSDGFEVVAPVATPPAETYSFAGAFGTQGSGNGEFNSPQGIVTDIEGNIYVVDQVNHRVQKFAPDGTFITKWGRNGGDGSSGTGGGEFDSPTGIAINAAGNLFVLDTGNHRVQKFTSDGEYVDMWGSYGSGDNQFNTPLGIAVDDRSFVYIADSLNNRIVKYTPDGNFVTKWDMDPIASPIGIAASQSNIYMKYHELLVKYNNVGSKLSEWRIDWYGPAYGLSSDVSGNIYSIHPNPWRDLPLRIEILKYLPDGTLGTRLATYGKGDGQLINPTFLHVDDSGTIYVADTGNNRIQKFTLNQPPGPVVTAITPNRGTQGTTVNLRIDGSGFLAGAVVRLQMAGHTDITATNVTVVSRNRITCTVTLRDSQTLGAWSATVTNTDGQYGTLTDGFEVVAPVIQPCAENYLFAREFGTQGSRNGEFNSPQGIVTDTTGNIYVVDQVNHRVQKFASDGTLITKWGRNGGDGSAGSGDGEYNSPQGIAIDAAGNLYVTDTGNHRVQKFTSNGEYIATWGAYGSDDDQFNAPLGIAVDENGDVYVADSQNNRVVKYTSDGEFVALWGVGCPVEIAAIHSNIYVKSAIYQGWESWVGRIYLYNTVGSLVREWDVELDNSPTIGIASDVSGNIYAIRQTTGGDTPLRAEILKYLPDGTLVTRFATYGKGDGQFINPTFIHVDDSGTVYVADTGNNRIQKFTLNQPPGPVVTAITPNRGTQGTTLNLMIDGSGFLDGAAVKFLRTDDTDITATNLTVVSRNRITCTITLQDSETVGPWSVRVTNTDGQYGTLTDGFEVVAPVTPPYAENYLFAREFGTQGSRNGEFNSPQGIVSDTAGYIYVVDQVNHRVQKFASDGTLITKWGRNGGDGSAGSGDGEYNSPQGIAIDAAGNLYVTDTGNHRVQKFTSNGEYIATWGAYGSDDDQFNTPLGIAVDEDGMVYVADSGNYRVVKYTSDGNFITKWDIADWWGLHNPLGIAVIDSNVYVKFPDVWGHGIVSQYNSVGSKIGEWGIESDDSPTSGIASDASGNIYAVRQCAGGDTPLRAEILKYLPDGTLVTRFATYGKGDSQLTDPTFLHVDDSGTVYCADTGSNRIVTFQKGSLCANFTGEPLNGTPPLTVQFNDTSAGEPVVWNWTFGDGSSSTEQHPAHIYMAAGTYTVSLTVSNDEGTTCLIRTGYVQVEEHPNGVFNPANGHYYKAMPVPEGITWIDANSAAQSLAPAGINGYLATITSQEENDFILNNLGGPYTLDGYWLGGFQAPGSEEPAGGWQWVTGELWIYTSWYYGEPNNNGDEKYVQLYAGVGAWNDAPDSYASPGYIVEYPLPGEPTYPTANFTASTTYGPAPLTVQFADTSIRDPAGWFWDFGDGDSSTEQNPAHVFTTPGIYTVNLTVTNGTNTHTLSRRNYITVDLPVIYAHQYSFTTNGDFNLGRLTGVEYRSVANQLQLSTEMSTLPFIWVPNSGSDTISKVNTITGRELGRYHTGPEGVTGNPSRTTVDQDGAVWFGNRNSGTVVKIGLLEAGQGVDRNGNGVIDTSQDANSDGDISEDEMLPWGQDECVLYEIVLHDGNEDTYIPGTYTGGYPNDYNVPGPRSIAVDSWNNIWAGTFGTMKFYYIDGASGEILRTVDVSSMGHTPYGAIMDANGILWSAEQSNGCILRLDPSTEPAGLNRIAFSRSTYGLAMDGQGHLFVTDHASGQLSRVDTTVNPPVIEWSTYIGNGVGATCTEDGNVWVCHYDTNRVGRYDNDGNLIALIDGFASPRGASVDSEGKVWVTDLDDEYIRRIDPVTNTIDLSKRIIGGGGHYSYSDMTGTIARSITTKVGTWTVTIDSEEQGHDWGAIGWNAFTPENTSITVKARSSANGNDWSAWETASNRVVLSSTPAGRFLQVQVILQIQQGTTSPVLYDLAVGLEGIPAANFTANVTSGDAPLTVQFTDISVGEPTGWNWTFGDGGMSNDKHPVHTYTAGNYTVSLTVTNTAGSDTMTRTGYISVRSEAETNTISVLPSSSAMTVGQTQAFMLVLDNASAGLAGCNITIRLTNSIVGEIIGVQHPSWASLPANSTVPADAVWCKAADLSGASGTADITLVTVIVRADAAGVTNITVIPDRVEDRAGGRYEPIVADAQIIVSAVKPFPNPSGGFFPPPTDPNGDGLYEDLDGNGWIGFNDVVIYYNNLEGIDTGTFGPVSLFDYDDNGWAGFNDVVRLYEMIG